MLGCFRGLENESKVMSEFIRSGVKVRNFFNVEKTSLSSQILTQIQRNGILRNQIWTQMKITIWIIWFSIQGAKTGKDNGFSVLFDIESFDYGYYDEGSEGLKVSLKLSMIWRCIFCLILLTARHPVYCGLDNTDFYFQDIYFHHILF